MTGVLGHIRVLDLSRVFAGPWAAQMLADFGADVLKIEHTAGGDDVRRMGVPHKDAAGKETGETSSHLAMNRGKRSIAIDLSKPQGQALVRQLAARSDVLIENFKVGNLARYGLDFASLAKDNPRLIYCSITGFGQDGPSSHLPGYDPIFQAMSGLMSVTGVASGEPGAGPALVGYSVSDVTAGYYATMAILAALNHRDQVSGVGQYIDIALMDAQVHAVSHMAMNYLASGRLPVRNGTASQVTCPWQVFDCADQPLMIAVGNDPQFIRLCEVLGLPALAKDARFITNRTRVENRACLIPLLAKVLRGRTAREWMQTLELVGVSSGPLNDFEQMLADPQVQHRQLKRTIPHPKSGAIDIIANPVRFSQTPVAYSRHPPLFAEHTAEVLLDVLGFVDAEIEVLRKEGVVR